MVSCCDRSLGGCGCLFHLHPLVVLDKLGANQRIDLLAVIHDQGRTESDGGGQTHGMVLGRHRVSIQTEIHETLNTRCLNVER